jgi:hypothetical protein
VAEINEDRKPYAVNVRWFDGLLETFPRVVECRASGDLLFLVLEDGRNRTIPFKAGVRWYSSEVESHERIFRRSDA